MTAIPVFGSGWMFWLALGAVAWLIFSKGKAVAEDQGALVCDAIPGATFRWTGVIGERVEANVEHWLAPAPVANPGMLEMFRKRDREPVPDLVPWAGEFVGKYLISAIQARRMTDHPELETLLREIIPELIRTQAEEGYLGPFRREERLLGHWDLWGHYHIMLALLMWYTDTGDPSARDSAIRAADLIGNTFLDTDHRILDAGSPEMNMAVIHALGWLYRITGTDRYLRLMREIEIHSYSILRSPTYDPHVVSLMGGDAVAVVGGDDRVVLGLDARRVAHVRGGLEVHQKDGRPPALTLVHAQARRDAVQAAVAQPVHQENAPVLKAHQVPGMLARQGERSLAHPA